MPSGMLGTSGHGMTTKSRSTNMASYVIISKNLMGGQTYHAPQGPVVPDKHYLQGEKTGQCKVLGAMRALQGNGSLHKKVLASICQ